MQFAILHRAANRAPHESIRVEFTADSTRIEISSRVCRLDSKFLTKTRIESTRNAQDSTRLESVDFRVESIRVLGKSSLLRHSPSHTLLVAAIAFAPHTPAQPHPSLHSEGCGCAGVFLYVEAQFGFKSSPSRVRVSV